MGTGFPPARSPRTVFRFRIVLRRAKVGRTRSCSTLMLPELLERARREAQDPQRQERQGQRRDREARREWEIETRKAELINEVRDHVDLTTADQLRRRKGAEGPGEGGR